MNPDQWTGKKKEWIREKTLPLQTGQTSGDIKFYLLNKTKVSEGRTPLNGVLLSTELRVGME